MSLAHRAGELFMIGFYGSEPDPGFEELLREQGVAGVILFARNLERPEQVRRLTGRLQSQYPDLPLLISIDQEGGVVSRTTSGGFGETATHWPGAMALGACASEELTEQVSRQMGLEIRALGINMNLAPVLDVNNNPANPVIGVRSYGEDPNHVARMGAAAIRGFQAAGLLATAKHFPGHGDTAVDSHLALAAVPHDRERLDQVELVPFRAAAAAGVDAIMTAHVVFPAVEPDPNTPATLSAPVLTGLLRQELGYDGLIITDCMEMKAISDNVGVAEAAIRTILAGTDLVLISHTRERQVEAIQAVREAIASGRIPAERVEQALRRVRAARERLAAMGPGPDLSVLGSAEHIHLATAAAERSVTAVGAVAASLPVAVDRTILLAVDPHPVVEVEENAFSGAPLMKAAGELAPAMRRMGIRRDPSPSDIERALKATGEADLVVVGTYLANRFAGQADLVQSLVNAGRKVIVIAQRGPYDLLATPGIAGALVIYEDRLPSARAALRCLLGQVQPTGTLPVSLSL